MNNYTNESNTLINNSEANIMNNNTNELNTLMNNTEVNTMNNNTNELMTLPKKSAVTMINLFDDLAVGEEFKSPQDWTISDCKDKLTVIFKETENKTIIVSVRLQGLTMLKVNKNKTTMEIPDDSFTKEEVLERIRGCDEMIVEAHTRLLASLKKAQISRETTFKRMPKGAKPEMKNKEKDGQECSQPSCSE